MSLTNFFLDSQIMAEDIATSGNAGFELLLSDEDLHHARVLRLKPGEHIGVIDASKNFYECEILNFDKSLIVKNSQKNVGERSELSQIWLCQGISKGSKFDDVVRACTEVGVCGFIPVAFARSVAKIDEKKEAPKQERWQKIAKNAAMQSGQFSIPKVELPVDVSELCERLEGFDHIFICWEETDSTREIYEVCEKIKSQNSSQKIAIIIGPEGGISADEVKMLQGCNEHSHIVSLGSSILRTETAGLVASAIIKFLTSC